MHKSMVEKKRRNENRVIISVYIESNIRRSDQKIDRIKRINPVRISSRSRVSRTRGYDRRAQLLAYARELRCGDIDQLKRPFKNSRRKSKKRRLATVGERIRRLFSGFQRVERLWKYEPIVKEDDCDCEKKWGYGSRKNFHFCKKLKYLLKKISGAWKCKSGIIY